MVLCESQKAPPDSFFSKICQLNGVFEQYFIDECSWDTQRTIRKALDISMSRKRYYAAAMISEGMFRQCQRAIYGEVDEEYLYVIVDKLASQGDPHAFELMAAAEVTRAVSEAVKLAKFKNVSYSLVGALQAKDDVHQRKLGISQVTDTLDALQRGESSLFGNVDRPTESEFFAIYEVMLPKLLEGIQPGWSGAARQYFGFLCKTGTVLPKYLSLDCGKNDDMVGKLLERAEEVARSIPDAVLRSKSLSCVGHLYAEMGDYYSAFNAANGLQDLDRLRTLNSILFFEQKRLHGDFSFLLEGPCGSEQDDSPKSPHD